MNSNTSRLTALALSALVAAGLVSGPAQAEPAVAGKATVPSASSAVLTRQQIVARADQALTRPTKYKLRKNGPVLLSRPNGGNNYLGGHNLNEYNNYNGQAWCGYFAAAMWGKQGVPSGYQSSQRWRTALGSRFHRYNAGSLPRPGDVLVWSNVGDAGHGHVGVVVAVHGRTITTIEGNTGTGTDSVARKTYSWSGRGPRIDGKNFRGFASPM